MAAQSIHIALKSNNHEMASVFCDRDPESKTRFQKDSPLSKPPYFVYLVDFENNLEGISQDLIESYESSRQKKRKIAIVLIFPSKIESEKIKYFQKLLADLGKDCPIHRIIIAKDLYQTDRQKTVFFLDKVIKKSIEDNSYQCSKKGANQYFPLSTEDFIKALEKILFLSNTVGKTFWIFGEKITDLELGYILKNNSNSDDNFQIDSIKEDNQIEPEYKNAANNSQLAISWNAQDDFEYSVKKYIDGIKESGVEVDEDKSNNSQKRNAQVRNILRKLGNPRLFRVKIHQPKKEVSQKKSKPIVVGLLVVIIAYLLNLGVFAWATAMQYQELSASLEHLRGGNLDKSVDRFKKVSYYKKISLYTYDPVKPILEKVNPRLGEEMRYLFSFEDYALQSLENLQQTYLLVEKAYQGLFSSDTNLDYKDISLALQSNLAQVNENVRQIKQIVDSKKLPEYIEEKITSSENYKNLDLIETQIDQSLKLTELIPQILKTGETQTVGILVQDQDELRSNGGVIKQLLILTQQGGKISEIKSYLQSDIDTLIEGNAISPEMVARLTGSSDFKFKDMNYIADFAQTSQYISWFLNKTLKIDLDYLISVNKSLIQKLIDEDISIEISGKNIKSSDLYSASQDSSLLSDSVNHYTNKFKSGRLEIDHLGRVVLNEIEEGNIQLWSKNNTSQSIIASMSLSGIVANHHCHQGLVGYENCTSQTYYLNESNFFNSPVNHSLDRNLKHYVTISKGMIQNEYQIEYQFQNDFTSLKRNYSAVYQLFTPPGSVINSVDIDGTPILLASVIKNSLNGFDYYHIPISMVPAGSHNIKIAFDSPAKVPDSLDNFAISITEMKQPGIKDPKSTLYMRFPEDVIPRVVTSEGQAAPGQYAIKLPSKTTTFGIGFSRAQ